MDGTICLTGLFLLTPLTHLKARLDKLWHNQDSVYNSRPTALLYRIGICSQVLSKEF